MCGTARFGSAGAGAVQCLSGVDNLVVHLNDPVDDDGDYHDDSSDDNSDEHEHHYAANDNSHDNSDDNSDQHERDDVLADSDNCTDCGNSNERRDKLSHIGSDYVDCACYVSEHRNHSDANEPLDDCSSDVVDTKLDFEHVTDNGADNELFDEYQHVDYVDDVVDIVPNSTSNNCDHDTPDSAADHVGNHGYRSHNLDFNERSDDDADSTSSVSSHLNLPCQRVGFVPGINGPVHYWVSSIAGLSWSCADVRRCSRQCDELHVCSSVPVWSD